MRRDLGKRIFYVHASDSDFLTEDHLEIGTGSVNWEKLFRALKKHDFQGFIKRKASYYAEKIW